MKGAFPAAVVLALVIAAPVEGASAPSVTGGFSYAYFGHTQTIDIGAHGGAMPSGSITATEAGPAGTHVFTGSVLCVNADGPDAWVAGAVTGGEKPLGYDGWAVRVHDGGTPGVNGDMAMLFVDTVATVVDICQKAPGRYDRYMVPVANGNLVVRD